MHLKGWQSSRYLKRAWPKGNVVEHFSQVLGYRGLYELGCRSSLASDFVNEEGRAGGACAGGVCLVCSS